ncbi:MAG: GNAT family N-acetyltransferase [Hyphomonadaceae bacterium]
MSNSYKVVIENDFDPEKMEVLWNQSPTAMIFNNPYWYLTNYQTFGPKRKIHHVTVWDADEQVASWPFWERRSRPHEALARVIEPIGARVSDYTCPLVKPGIVVEEVVDLMLAALRQKLGPTSILLVPKYSPPGDENSDLSQLPSVKGLLSHHYSRPCTRQKFGTTFEETEMAWKSSLRRELRRCGRRLEERGEVSLKVYETADEITARLPTLFEMHIKEWEHKKDSSDFLNERDKDLFRTLAKFIPEDRILYSELLLDGEPISCQFGFLDQGWLMLFKQTMDMEFRDISAGKLHFIYLIKWGIERGYHGLDLMQGSESYKRYWQNDPRESISYAFSDKSAFPVWLWNTKYRKMKIEYWI